MDAFLDKIYHAHQLPKSLPGKEEIETFVEMLLGFLFPEMSTHRLRNRREVENQFQQIRLDFEKLLYQTEACNNQQVESICRSFFGELPTIHALCLEDAQAICEGDPAAFDQKEVIRSYPGFLAIAIYRIAHQMCKLSIPYLPRILTEYAHSKTGIDIHPSARIGHRFCIDHGTGVVIGETTQIGDDVKIYQGVTLGALSVNKELAKKKRHPTIEDEVVIYSGATILGGNTVIGKGSVIGGNVWLTKSVAAHSKVYYSAADQLMYKP